MIWTCSFCIVVDIYWTCKERGGGYWRSFHDWDQWKGGNEDNFHMESHWKRIRSSWGRFEFISMCSDEPPNFLHYEQHNYQLLKRRRRRGGLIELTTKALNNRYHSPNSSAHFPQKLTSSPLNTLGIFILWAFWLTSPYLGSVVCLHSEVPSRSCHYCWPLSPEQRWCRDPMSSPHKWNCGDSEWVTGTYNF